MAQRAQWGSRMGFIMAAAGSAVGLGNIWGFPYMTGRNGGGLFVLAYLVCVAVIIAVPATGLGAMLHVTPDYNAQQTTMAPGVGVPFDVYVYADDLTNGGLAGAEFALTAR